MEDKSSMPDSTRVALMYPAVDTFSRGLNMEYADQDLR